MIAEICILVLMLVCSFEDLRKKEIALWKIGLCGVVSLFRVAMQIRGGNADYIAMLLALLPGAFLLGISFVTREGIGYGDGLLMLSIGPGVGLVTLVTGMFIAFFASSIFSAGLLLTKKVKRNHRIPFIPFLTIGLGVMVFA